MATRVSVRHLSQVIKVVRAAKPTSKRPATPTVRRTAAIKSEPTTRIDSTPAVTTAVPHTDRGVPSEPASLTPEPPNDFTVNAPAEPSLQQQAQAHLASLDNATEIAWGSSYDGISLQAFDDRISKVLLQPLDPKDIEIKPDGIIYLPEIKYRRILNRSFGPGGWGLVPRGPHTVTDRSISREYALICLGRFVSQARGEQDYFNPNGLPTASEGCKSNALMRCCKDLGIASELWDPAFIYRFKRDHCKDVWASHVERGNKKRLWRRKDRTLDYPWKEA
ncbi:hypothetical protein H4R35_006652 [Dimargaris xerosporica]|nr:hypothetical protein H4R35_006652 [Dimargaris xerosporica]